jgi:hypothetical protein
VAWLEFRFNVVFLDPFRKFLELDGQCYIWLCILSLATLAIDSLAKFEYTGKDAFVRFVEEFFPSGAFMERKLRLRDPRPDRKTKVAQTPAQHLYKFFRSSIAHDFCIDWGGLLHREDGAPSYLFEVLSETTSMKEACLGTGLGMAPRDFAKTSKMVSVYSSRRSEPGKQILQRRLDLTRPFDGSFCRSK